MLIRSITENETEGFLNILCLVFNLYKDSAKQIFYKDPFFDLSHKLACFENDTMVSCLTIIPSGLRIGSANVPIGGIAGVATLPEYRRKGYAGNLLSYAVSKQCPNLGYYLTALHAVDDFLYKQHGFITSTISHYCRFSSKTLPAYSEYSLIRDINKDDPADYMGMNSLYNKHILEDNNGALRTDGRWHIIYNILPNRKLVVCKEQQRITGYAHMEHTKHSLIIHEMIADTETAVRALLGYLSKQNSDNIEWHTSISQLIKFGIDPGTAIPQPGAMMCVTDLEQLLKLLYKDNFAPIMHDRNDTLSIIVKNEERCILTINNQGICQSDISSSQYIELDMLSMVQLITGYKSTAIAYETGNINISGSNALELADLLFPPRDPFIGSPDQF